MRRAKKPKSIDDLLAEVAALEQRARDALRYDAVSRLLRRRDAFNQVCALLDFIGDSDSAIWSVSTAEKRAPYNLYFFTYGLLETLQSRETALRTMLKKLKVSIPNSFSDSGVGVPRSRVSAHFLTSDGAPHVIIRNSMSVNQFEYWTYRPKHTDMGNIVVYDDLIRAHLRAAIDGLSKLVAGMNKIENRRRARMSKKPLMPMLRGVDYATRSLVAATMDEKYVPAIAGHIDIIAEALKKLRPAVAKRMGEEPAEYHIDHVVEGLKLLKSLSGLTDRSETLRFRVVAEGIELNIKQLTRLAMEIDQNERTRLRTKGKT